MAGDIFQVIDPDGGVFTLNDGTVCFLLGEDGFGLDDIDIIEERTPYVDGATFKGITQGTREPVVFLGVYRESMDVLEAYEEQLQRNLNPFRGEYTLRVIRMDGRTRDIKARLRAYPWSTNDKDGPLWASRKLIFHCPDPHFYDPVQAAQVVTLGPSGLVLPFTLAATLPSTAIDTTFTAQNAGDLPTYPVLVITGPGTNPVITNNTSGKVMSLTQVLDTGDTVTIDMLAATIMWYDASGGTTTSILQTRSASSAFWPLVRGSNSIRVQMTSASNGGVAMTWYNRYLVA